MELLDLQSCCHSPLWPGAYWCSLVSTETAWCQKCPGVMLDWMRHVTNLSSITIPTSCTKRVYPPCLQICYLFQVRMQTFLLPSAPAVHIGAFRCQTAFRKLLFPTQAAAALSSITPAGTASAAQVSDLPLNLRHWWSFSLAAAFQSLSSSYGKRGKRPIIFLRVRQNQHIKLIGASCSWTAPCAVGACPTGPFPTGCGCWGKTAQAHQFKANNTGGVGEKKKEHVCLETTWTKLIFSKKNHSCCFAVAQQAEIWHLHVADPQYWDKISESCLAKVGFEKSAMILPFDVPTFTPHDHYKKASVST